MPESEDPGIEDRPADRPFQFDSAASDDGFGDDFDEFEAGAEAEDFGDFNDGFEQPSPGPRPQRPEPPQVMKIRYVSNSKYNIICYAKPRCCIRFLRYRMSCKLDR